MKTETGERATQRNVTGRASIVALGIEFLSSLMF